MWTYLIHPYSTNPTHRPKRRPNPISRFATVHSPDRPTDRQTDRPTDGINSYYKMSYKPCRGIVIPLFRSILKEFSHHYSCSVYVQTADKMYVKMLIFSSKITYVFFHVWSNFVSQTLPSRDLTFSADLISSELSGREATQFAVAATNQNRLAGWRRVFVVSRGSSLGSLSASTCVLTGRSHGELGRFTAVTQFKVSHVGERNDAPRQWQFDRSVRLEVEATPLRSRFLADRTIGRAYGTVCRLSSVVCRL